MPAETAGNPNATYQRDPMKPMPVPGERAGTGITPPPFEDGPLLNQHPPEQREFVEAYRRVGSPRMTVLVNPILRSGEDELSARAIDYVALETILADWFASSGQVTLVSPSVERQSLSDQQVKDLESGSADAARRVGQQMDVEVLVQVRVEPTQQAGRTAARLVSEAINTRGGQSIARAVVDVPPPLDKTQLEKSTRVVARQLMDEMSATWNSFPAVSPAPVAPPAPPAPPAPLVPPAPVAPPAPIAPAPPAPPAPSAVAPVAPPAPSAPTPPPPAPSSAAPVAPPAPSTTEAPAPAPPPQAPATVQTTTQPAR